MCLINFAYKQHTNYPFILVGNRDEFYQRPTQQLHWWDDFPQILAGRDLKDSGTWMGMTNDGKFAALTNYRDPKHIKTDAPSRGKLLVTYLSGEMTLQAFHNHIKTTGAEYNGFNLLYGNMESMFYYANTNDRWHELTPGIYALSNAYLDTPWPKTLNSKNHFLKTIEAPVIDTEMLFPVLNDKTLAPDDALPATGVPFEVEKKLSAMFIQMEQYGTRLTSSIIIDNNGKVDYAEKSYIPSGNQYYTFTIK